MAIIADPNQHRGSKKPDFSLTTVNIVLLLVFFFLITGTITETREMPIDLSQTANLPLDQLPKPLLLILEDGTLMYDQSTVDIATAAERIRGNDPMADGLKAVHILADKDLRADMLVAIIQNPAFAPFDINLVTLHQRGTPQ